MQIKVKICGITNAEDANAAIDLGADALGFIFVPDTPRYIEPHEAKQIVGNLPPFITTVGVMADKNIGDVSKIIKICGLNAVQLHGSETPKYCSTLYLNCRTAIIKGFRIKDRNSLLPIPEYKVNAYLLDTYVKGKKGGTGETFNWDLANEAKKYGKIIIAGGLTHLNVAQAVQHIRPYAVDVSSGVEASPGRKDHTKVEEFIKNARAIEG